MGIFDYFKKKDDQEEKDILQQLHDPLFDFSHYLCNENEQACSLDEIPEGVGEFGIDPKNPIPMLALFGLLNQPVQIYLNSLLTEEGKRVTGSRIGSLQVENINFSVDKWEIVDFEGNHKNFIYVSLYHKKISQKSPKGFLLNSYSVALENDSLLGRENFIPLRGRYMDLAKESLPEDLKDIIPLELIRVLVYAQRFLLVGPDEYRKEDYFNFPLEEFDVDELYFGAVQIFNYYKGISPNHYIKLKNIDNLKALLLTLSHYQLVKSEHIDNNLTTKVLKATFKHKLELEPKPPKMTKDITLYFKLSE